MLKTTVEKRMQCLVLSREKGMTDGPFVPRAHLESLGTVEAGSCIHRSTQYTMSCHDSYSMEYMPHAD